MEEAVREGTGPVSSFAQFLNNTLGAVQEGQISPETSTAKQTLRTFNQSVKDALTVNPRNPVAELKTIQGFLPDPDAIFVDPDGQVQNIRNFEQFLLNKRQSDLESLRRNPSEKVRENALERIDAIDRALGIMNNIGTPQQQLESKLNPEQIDKLQDIVSQIPDTNTRGQAENVIDLLRQGVLSKGQALERLKLLNEGE